ncbi:MAG: transcriptional regulator [Rhodobacteraceae bacterium]|nr:transcriptional regulator [Paracoccaceae bacterium]
MNTGQGHTPFPALPGKRYEVLYADPPWDYKGQRQHNGPGGSDTGGANAHYDTVTLAALERLDIQGIAADNAVLFMWSSSPHLDQAIRLGKAWGFSWATIAFIWNKMKTNPGFYTLSQCELCLVFKRGKIPQPRGARNIRQYLEVERGRHSEKPDEVRKRIEQMFPKQSKIELFARDKAPGWCAWGLEADGT